MWKHRHQDGQNQFCILQFHAKTDRIVITKLNNKKKIKFSMPHFFNSNTKSHLCAKSRNKIVFNYFLVMMGGGGGVGSLGLPSHTDLLNRPFITGGCHLLLPTTLVAGFSAAIVAILTALKMATKIIWFTFVRMKETHHALLARSLLDPCSNKSK